MKVIVIDTGGTNAKMLAIGHKERSRFASGPNLTPQLMVAGVKKLAVDWACDVVSMGYPGIGVKDRIVKEPHSLAWRLRGARFNEGDLYAMINAHDRPLKFHIQEGTAKDWQRIVDTDLPSPLDISDPGSERQVASLDYEVGARSVVVLTRKHTG